MPNETAASHRPRAKERLREELHRYLAVSAYLYVCFAVILLYKAAILSSSGERFLPLGQAVAALSDRSVPEVLASCLLMLLVLIPLVTVTEMSRALGPGARRHGTSPMGRFTHGVAVI